MRQAALRRAVAAPRACALRRSLHATRASSMYFKRMEMEIWCAVATPLHPETPDFPLTVTVPQVRQVAVRLRVRHRRVRREVEDH